MNTNKYIAWCSACIVICIGIMTIILDVDIRRNNTRSPVEEMYHKQLVNTIDSVLDARFGSGCCEEDTDTVSANTFNTRFSSNILPMD